MKTRALFSVRKRIREQVQSRGQQDGVHRGFSRRGMHQYAHDFDPPLGFFLVRQGIEKTKHDVTFDLLHSM